MVSCCICNRDFKTVRNLELHSLNSPGHEWCDRCLKVFSSLSAKRQHVENSPKHHACLRCTHRPDFEFEETLDIHLRDVHYYCEDCDTYFKSSQNLRAVTYWCQIRSFVHLTFLAYTNTRDKRSPVLGLSWEIPRLVCANASSRIRCLRLPNGPR